MKYRAKQNIEINAFQWGADEAPEWIKGNCENVDSSSGPRLIINQPEGNKDLAWGTETVAKGDFVIFTAGGSFQVLKPDQFFKRFVIRTRD